MKIRRTSRFERSYSKAPKEIQAALDKQVGLLAQDLLHPSLHVMKSNESLDLWQGMRNPR
jgi:hypothetical protein